MVDPLTLELQLLDYKAPNRLIVCWLGRLDVSAKSTRAFFGVKLAKIFVN